MGRFIVGIIAVIIVYLEIWLIVYDIMTIWGLFVANGMISSYFVTLMLAKGRVKMTEGREFKSSKDAANYWMSACFVMSVPYIVLLAGAVIVGIPSMFAMIFLLGLSVYLMTAFASGYYCEVN